MAVYLEGYRVVVCRYTNTTIFQNAEDIGFHQYIIVINQRKLIKHTNRTISATETLKDNFVE